MRYKGLTQIFLDRNRFDKGKTNEVRIESTFKRIKDKGGKDKTRTKLTETTLITLTSIHTNKTKHQNKV